MSSTTPPGWNSRRALFGAPAGLAAGTLVLPRAARAFPDRPVRLVVPFAPGGPSDIIARALLERLSAGWPRGALVENRPGAGGNIGADHVAKSAPDGHTLLVPASSLVTAPALVANLPFDPLRDFTPLLLAASHPMILLVPARSPAQDLPGFVAMARTAGGGVSFGSGGIGNASHLAAALLASRAGFDWTHVPYGGAAPSQTALLGGQVQAIFQNPILSVPAVRDGRLRALAVTGAERWRDLPDVPTVAEAGLPGFEAISWYGVLGPAGLPAPVAAGLETALRAALRAPEVEARLLQAGLELHGDGGAAFRARMERDLEAWGAVIRRLGIRPE